MRRTKRLSIEVRHREVTITIAGSTQQAQVPGPPGTTAVAVCPVCGSPWITIAARIDGDSPANTDRVHSALMQSGLHLQVSPAGQLWICQRSFEALKEKF
jgi:hypothetical protein